MCRRRCQLVDVVVVHRRAPAEDVVAGDEGVQHGGRDVDERDGAERRKLAEELFLRDGVGLCQRLLDHVVEGAEPVVDHHVELDVEPDEKDDERRNAHRPTEPAVRQQPADQPDEDRAGRDHVLVEPDVARGLDGDGGPVGVGRRIGKADQTADAELGAEVAGGAVPQGHAERGPQDDGREEEFGLREEGGEHPSSIAPQPRRGHGKSSVIAVAAAILERDSGGQ